MTDTGATYSDRFNSVEQMRDATFFDGPRSRQRYSRFWLLLILSTIIASAGVVGDSTATVIGAMIVAPLMTPILGVTLATVIGDRSNLVRSLLLVLAGAATALAIGYLVGLVVVNDVLANTNAQVAARVTPRLIDLLAALATGVVGSVALVRKDISDTLPGVAIAISLVPPLAVAGLALESGSVRESLGAVLLFVTNVVAIIGTGIIVASLYGVTRLARTDGQASASLRNPLLLLAVMLVIIGTPLAATSTAIATRTLAEQSVKKTADEWAARSGWFVTAITSQDTELIVNVEGLLPLPNTETLRVALQAAGVDVNRVTVKLVPGDSVSLSD
ncbi:DUF389 domain-containing protein [Cryobacterium sp. CG_9.6]|uniref:DUF389 domain-containing protein n=1 Tax=Cryobacterium sp. CG_9.6 TaxID=2760710 RepID=UPI00247429FB|nr:DUF389 domain-containing protein [Cryobacterium sp. CG_9.6]MDH6238157.1 putative hydrophobic protein (TIGR00271 family) [Cryobacterium sp. CG_9.6]